MRAFKDQLVISHLISKLSIDSASSGLLCGTDAPSMFAVLTSGDHSSVAYLSGLSFAEALFGRVHKLDDMLRHSTQLYSHALQRLRHELLSTNKEVARSRAYMNIWSVVLLGMYELVSSTNFDQWLEHSRGLATLASIPIPCLCCN